ncbi:VOC family protein [Aestuariimicrobium ganziense]|uniref:VOC family protein n=1 Tax=Aestuariimicrobium ganziense TaxID=2773677 RepID=UPI001941A7CC|nr:VOC family protein [Aestuariimicrobium ganziense]
MTIAVHTLAHSDDPAATRTFFGEVLGLAFVADDDSSEPGAQPDTDQAWLIFDTGPSELGVHPTAFAADGAVERAPRHHQISFMVDDITAATDEITSRGGQLVSRPTEFFWGTGVEVAVPGSYPVLVHQAAHRSASKR